MTCFNFKGLMTSNTTSTAPLLGDEKVSRVLVIYTGGTIGMKKNKNNAYEVVPNYFAQALKKLPMLYDDEYDENCNDEKNHPIYNKYPKLVMPISKMGVRVLYYVKELDPILDSSNMSMRHWSMIAKEVKDHYRYYDSFVILHGTDTMAYTASALSYMFENLNKTVVITGSQIPIFEHRSDGQGNLVGALEIAGHFTIPEVTLFFNNKLFRGNRCQKVSSSDIDAFDSPNLHSLAKLGTNIEISWSSVLPVNDILPFTVQEKMSENVGLLQLFPGISSQIVKAVLSSPMEGVIIESFGAGNVPSDRPDIMNEFKAAAKRGVLLLNITQCHKGSVSDAYAAGKVLFDIGVIPGLDMTPEAALTKMAFVLGKKDLTLDQKRYLLANNIRGEMSGPFLRKQLSSKARELMKLVSATLEQEPSLDMNTVQEALIPLLMTSAGKNGDIDTIKTLVDQGAKVNEQSPYDGKTALHLACSEGNLPMVKYLLDEGALACVRDIRGCTPLSYAVQNRKIDVVECLLNTGTPFDCDDVDVARELCSAVYENDIGYLEMMKVANVDLNACDVDGRTALHVAVSKKNMKAVDLLTKESSLNVHKKDLYGYSPLENAQRLLDDDMINILVKANNTNDKNQNILRVSNNNNNCRINCKMNCGA